jgi:hypothetical protein
MEGVDFAFSNPTPAGLAAAGKRFAMRYVGPGTSPKHLTVTEATALKAAGLSLVTLVEGATGDPRGGFSVGAAHARSAVSMCRARGFPLNRPMYFAIDYDTATSTWPAAREYLRGAGSVIGAELVGVYGEYDVMVWAARDRVASWFFQTYAWSGGKWYAGNHVEQYHNGVRLAGGVVDLCRSKVADFGQWGQGGVAPPQTHWRDGMETFLIDDGTGAAGVWYDTLKVYEMAANGDEIARWQRESGKPTIKITRAQFEAGRVGVSQAAIRGLLVGAPPAPGEPGGLVPHTHAGGTTGPAQAV